MRTRSIYLFAPLGLLLASGLLACDAPPQPNVDEIEHELGLFGAKAGNGLAEACTELDNLCQQQGLGCKAHEMLCDSNGQLATIEQMICQRIDDACASGFGDACQLAQQHCGAGGTPTPPAAPTPPAPPATPTPPAPAPPTPPSAPTPAPPATPGTPATPDIAACCQALQTCVADLSTCDFDQALAACAPAGVSLPSMPQLPQVTQVGQVCQGNFASPEMATCCAAIEDCIAGNTDCQQALQSCTGASMPTMPAMPNVPKPGAVPSLGDIFDKVCPAIP